MKALRSRDAVVAIAMVVLWWPAANAAQTQATDRASALVGAWTLNADLSDKPQDLSDNAGRGEGRQPGGSDRPGGFGGGRGGAGRGGAFGGPAAGGGMSPEDRQRMRDALRDIIAATDRLTIIESNSMIIVTAGDGRVERLSPDGRKVADESTRIARRSKWDGDKLVTEITGAAPRKITKTYWVDAAHQQLHVTVQLDNPDRPTTVNRVYDAVASAG
jgi:hypothetical protein